MAVTPDRKKTVITESATHKGDTGSPEVQVALITERIPSHLDPTLKSGPRKSLRLRRSAASGPRFSVGTAVRHAAEALLVDDDAAATQHGHSVRILACATLIVVHHRAARE